MSPNRSYVKREREYREALGALLEYVGWHMKCAYGHAVVPLERSEAVERARALLRGN